MSVSLYDLTITPMTRGLGILSAQLAKAETYAAEYHLDPVILITARLAPDMLPLAGQVQRASDNAKGGVSRMADVQAPVFDDNETTFPQLQSRIAKTVAFLQSITPEQMTIGESRQIELSFRSVTGVFTGEKYALTVLLPNFYFHLTTAHAILRHNGLKIGKKDYIGSFD